MIDPMIWQDEEFGSLTSGAKILFIGLFSNADDEGRIRANPAYLKSSIFMYDDITPAIVKTKRDEVVEKMSSVVFYEIDGKEYIQLKNWNEFQKQHKDRITPSTLPPYIEDVTDNVGQVTDNVGVDKVRLVKVSLDQVSILAKKSQVSQDNPKLHERLPEEKQKPIHRLGYFLEDTLKTKIVNWGKSGKAVAMILKAGYTEDQIKWTIKEMSREDFYQDKGFDLMTVANNIDKYKAKVRNG